MKKGYYFTIDAMMAAALIATGLILASTLYVQETRIDNLFHYSQDLQAILSSVKLHELNSSLLDSWMASGIISDLNKTILDQAGEFWAAGNESLAAQLLNLTSGVIPLQFKYGIYFGDEFVFGASEPASSSLVSSKKIVSGIAKGKPAEGFSSKAQLKSFEARNSFAYTYFAGFAGQGNMTYRLVLPDSFINVTNATLELNPSDNFSLYINDNFAGSYIKGAAGGGFMSADKWTINSSYLPYFVPGTNFINVTFNYSLGYIGGGFLRVTYVTSSLNDSDVKLVNGPASDRYYFPRIEGLINLYDSFFVPGTLSTLIAHLHYNSSFNTFLTIGNATVFSLNSTEVQVVDLSNDNLASRLNYATLSSTTVPVRFGSGTGNSTIFSTGNADVVLANDLSGSMEYCANNTCSAADLGPEDYCGTNHKEKPSIGTYCNYTQENYLLPNGSAVCSYRWHALCPAGDTRKLNIAINASKQFATVLLGTLGNKMGIVGFTNPAPSVKVVPAGGSWNDRFDPFPDSIVTYENLTGSPQVIFNNINNFMDSYWESCLCCGVEKARDILLNGTTTGRFKSMVVMSDGEATDKCTGVGGGDAKQDAIEAANSACTDHNISVNTVGFGSSVDVATLQAMACNNGSFYNASNLADLIEVYKKIADDINKVTYKEQLINFSGELPAPSLLFGDSYIEYNYTPDVVSQFGVIPVTLQTPRFGNNISETIFNLPSGITLYQLKVTSYSSGMWTDNLTVSNSVPLRQGFSLQQFGSVYQTLGDPFLTYAKPNLFESGDNLVHISTATAPGNSTGGSVDNLMIYTLLVPNSVQHGGAFGKADGCLWHMTFEDGTDAIVPIPDTYSGPENCYFNPPSFTPDDAIDDAIYRLLKLMDFDSDGLLDIKFQPEDLGVGIATLSTVPSLWGPSVAEVRVWQ